MKVSLPSDRRREIETLVRREHGITAAQLARARRLSVIAGLLGLGIAVAFGYAVGRIWQPGLAFAYFVSGFAPVIVAMLSYSLLKRLITSWAMPEWQAYVGEMARRIRTASDGYRNNILRSAGYWQNLNEPGFACEFARLLQAYGYRTEIRDTPNDDGVDIVAYDVSGPVAVRCLGDNEPASPSVVRELYGIIVAGEYESGILATTDEVSTGVRDFVRGKPIRIIDMPEMIRMQSELDGRSDPGPGLQPDADNDPGSGAQERT